MTGRTARRTHLAGLLAALLPGLLVALMVAGCGIGAQERPDPLVVPGAPSAEVSRSPVAGGVALRVYFLRGSRLEAVERSAPDAGSRTALDLLAAGPSRTEVLEGLRTAVAPQAVVSGDARVVGSTVEVTLTREFTAVSGSNQLFAVAQVVWTLTESPQVTAVRFSAEGAPIEVPTDAGLTDLPVDREDYRSVGAPEPPGGPPGAAPTSSR